MTRLYLALIAIILAGSFYLRSSAPPAPTGLIIRRADHILVQSEDPEALFSFFADMLQLPIAWSPAETQGFVSGGLGAGNVNLEMFRYAKPNTIPARKVPEAHYAGLAFEPFPLADALRELRLRGIRYSPPEPYLSTLPNGSRGALWTTVALPSFSQPGMSVFLYECSPAFLNVQVRREQLGNRLTLNNGGPLGFQSVSEIVIAASNPEKEKAAWRLLLGEQDASGVYHAGDGPAIRLIQDSRDQIREIVLRVHSLDRARAFLKENRLLGVGPSKEALLNPSRVQGLKIRLREQTSAVTP